MQLFGFVFVHAGAPQSAAVQSRRLGGAGVTKASRYRSWDEAIGAARRGDVLVVTSLRALGIDPERRRRADAQLLADRYRQLARRRVRLRVLDEGRDYAGTDGLCDLIAAHLADGRRASAAKGRAARTALQAAKRERLAAPGSKATRVPRFYEELDDAGREAFARDYTERPDDLTVRALADKHGVSYDTIYAAAELAGLKGEG